MNFVMCFDRVAVFAVSLALGFAAGCSSDPSPTLNLIDAGAPDAPDGGEPDAPPAVDLSDAIFDPERSRGETVNL